MLWLRRFGIWLVSLYALYTAALIALQGSFIYPFSDRPFSSADYARVEVPVPEAAPLPVRVARGQPGAPVVVYFMGNVGALDLFLPMLEHHRQRGRTVVAMTYRGGGGTEGSPSETRLKADALAVMQSVPEIAGEGPVVVQGFSLGTGLALHAAAARPDRVSGVLLAAPYARLCELMERQAKVPACTLPGVQAWRSADRLEGIAAPTLILHGGADTLIPPDQSARLAAAMGTQGLDVTRQIIPDAAHNNLMRFPAYLRAIDAFIDAL